MSVVGQQGEEQEARHTSLGDTWCWGRCCRPKPVVSCQKVGQPGAHGGAESPPDQTICIWCDGGCLLNTGPTCCPVSQQDQKNPGRRPVRYVQTSTFAAQLLPPLTLVPKAVPPGGKGEAGDPGLRDPTFAPGQEQGAAGLPGRDGQKVRDGGEEDLRKVGSNQHLLLFTGKQG